MSKKIPNRMSELYNEMQTAAADLMSSLRYGIKFHEKRTVDRASRYWGLCRELDRTIAEEVMLGNTRMVEDFQEHRRIKITVAAHKAVE